jgi:hypothetical protein
MPALLIVIGVVLAVAAIRNSQGNLGTALETDLPGFFKWALAIGAVGGAGYVPGFQTVSRWMLGLILLVLVLTNYQRMFAGFTTLETSPPTGGTAATTPSAAYAANPTQAIPVADVTGTTTGNVNAAGQPAIATTPLTAGQLMLASAEAGIPSLAVNAALSGFGGVA